MQMTFLAVYFLLVPAACAFVLYKFARLWLWSSPILATLAGAVMAAVYLGGLPNPADDRWLTYWLLLMPIQQLIAISFCLGTLAGMRWGGSLGLAIAGTGAVLGLMTVAVIDSALLLYPLCLVLYAGVLVLSFTGKAKKAWDEYRQGNDPEL